MVRLASVALLSLGFVQASGAGMSGSQQVIQGHERGARFTRLDTTLARHDAASQRIRFGVDPLAVQVRVNNMTDAEVVELGGGLDRQVAGGSAVFLVGAVFIVPIVVEIVGITDNFKNV